MDGTTPTKRVPRWFVLLTQAISATVLEILPIQDLLINLKDFFPGPRPLTTSR